MPRPRTSARTPGMATRPGRFCAPIHLVRARRCRLRLDGCQRSRGQQLHVFVGLRRQQPGASAPASASTSAAACVVISPMNGWQAPTCMPRASRSPTSSSIPRCRSPTSSTTFMPARASHPISASASAPRSTRPTAAPSRSPAVAPDNFDGESKWTPAAALMAGLGWRLDRQAPVSIKDSSVGATVPGRLHFDVVIVFLLSRRGRHRSRRRCRRANPGPTMIMSAVLRSSGSWPLRHHPSRVPHRSALRPALSGRRSLPRVKARAARGSRQGKAVVRLPVSLA